MAITTVQAGSRKLRTIKLKKTCLGPGGAVLQKGQTVRVPEMDAHTLVSGEQADFVSDADLAKFEKVEK